MSLNQKSFQEDKVAMLCVLYIHHPPWILNRTIWERKRKKINPFFHHLPPSYFSPSNVKNGTGSHLGKAKFSKWFSPCLHLCSHLQYVRNTYQSKRKTVFQFLILFLKVVVLVRIAVRELVDLNFSVGQLLTIGIKKQSGKCNSLYPMLAFMIFSFFFLTSDFVRQSAFARTGMRFTWHLHYQLGNLTFLHFQFQTSLCVLCFSHFILQPS